MKLKDKVAIVTGGGHGMGREMALAFAEEGANLVLADINQSAAESVAQEVKALGRKALPVPADVTVEEQVGRMVQKTVDEFGRVDILVNNAGGSFGAFETMVADLSLADWQMVLDINLTGAFLCSRAVVRHMMEKESGVIINITAGMGQRGKAGMGALCAAKFGLEGLSQAMARELAPFNIRVNALKPGGGVATRQADQHPGTDRSSLLPPTIIREAAVYLASDDSAGVTAQSLEATTYLADQKVRRELLEHRGK